MGYAGAVAVRVNPWGLGYQLVPALGAAPREHLAAALGGAMRARNPWVRLRRTLLG